MKRVYCFLGIVLLVFMLVPVNAQTSLGFIGGLNLANVSIDPDMDVDWKNLNGLAAGGVLDFQLGDAASIRLEPMYLQKGTMAEEGDNKLEYKANYLEVPVLLKYALGSGEAKPFILAGPSIGYLLDAKLKATEGSESMEMDIKDVTKSIDLSLNFGAGFLVPLGKNSCFITARYALGLTNANDDPEDSETDIKTRGIQFLAGITFPLGG